MDPQYPILDEAFDDSPTPSEAVSTKVTQGREKIDQIISEIQEIDLARIEKRRQNEKNRRLVVEAARRKNRRKINGS